MYCCVLLVIFFVFGATALSGPEPPHSRGFYRVSIKSFPNYKHLLQETYVEYKHIFYDSLS